SPTFNSRRLILSSTPNRFAITSSHPSIAQTTRRRDRRAHAHDRTRGAAVANGGLLIDLAARLTHSGCHTFGGLVPGGCQIDGNALFGQSVHLVDRGR